MYCKNDQLFVSMGSVVVLKTWARQPHERYLPVWATLSTPSYRVILQCTVDETDSTT